MKDALGDAMDRGLIDPTIEAIFFLTDEELSGLIRSNFGDETEFDHRATAVFDRAIADFEGRKKTSMAHKRGPAKVIDIQSRLVSRSSVKFSELAHWQICSLDTLFRRVAVSGFVLAFSVLFALIASPIVEQAATYIYAPKEAQQTSTQTLTFRDRSWEESERRLRAALQVQAALKARDAASDEVFFTPNLDEFTPDFILSEIYDENLSGSLFIYERPSMILGAMGPAPRPVKTSVIFIPFDARQYALRFESDPQASVRTSGLESKSIVRTRTGFVPEGSSARD